jgi:hypothetical protein
MKTGSSTLIAAILMAVAASAGAQAAPDPAEALAAAAFAKPGAPTASRSGPGAARARADASLPTGVARTSIDHRFAPDGLIAEAGFLCGLQPSRNDRGASAARGYDPHGRFLGAKLRLAFR